MLSVVVIADRLPAQRWTQGSLALAIVRALARRGHRVDLLCDSLENPDDLAAAGVAVRTRAEFDHRARTAIKPLAAWARQQFQGRGDAAVLSLSRVPLGDVWLPLAPSPRAHLGRLPRRLGPRGGPWCWGAVLHDLKHWPIDVLDGRSERAAAKGCDPRRILCWGPAAAREARRALPAWAERVRALPLPSLHARPPAAEAAALRARTRALLAIEPDRLVVLVSMPEGVDHHLIPVLVAGAHLHAGHRGRGPLLLITTNDGVAIRRAAVATGAAGAVRVTALTQRFDALLAASDLAAVVAPRHGDAWTGASPARFMSEAMAWSRPVLAIRGAGGGEHLHRAEGASVGPGLVVAQARAVDWYVALQTAMDPTWRVSSGIAARATADLHGFALERVIDEVERELAEAAARRGGRSATPRAKAKEAPARRVGGGAHPAPREARVP